MNNLNKIVQHLIESKAAKIQFATAFVWYNYIINESEISLKDINEYFTKCSLPKYNQTFLKRDLRASKNVTKGTKTDTYVPVRKYIDSMNDLYSFAIKINEEIQTDDSIIPDILTKSTRGYIENLAKQINASYNYHIYDGCAILMRRLLEILLIHSYESHQIENLITENDGYKNLSYIINYTCSNKPFTLSKDAIETLDSFRIIGNFSAHRIQYNAKRKDIENIKLHYRMAIEELLYASKIKR
ncbi:DUF4145 domain-containing protein [Flavobacterium silvisoli]|uniref:DUF4145 domain-containing protein n=1 Tax=Flavobacterium silvisoli TaxID=2529433 RepID=A0A4Q9YT02_9FLAO|nr:DUF4145 domain-containing protein [Flavobacterium silvisoli]TBX66657.1 DUF4145 domain-containing protein [Flavobacterium silvisoli]